MKERQNRLRKVVIDDANKDKKTSDEQVVEARKEAIKIVEKCRDFLVIGIEKPDSNFTEGVTMVGMKTCLPMLEAMKKIEKEIMVTTAEQMLKYLKK